MPHDIILHSITVAQWLTYKAHKTVMTCDMNRGVSKAHHGPSTITLGSTVKETPPPPNDNIVVCEESRDLRR